MLPIHLMITLSLYSKYFFLDKWLYILFTLCVCALCACMIQVHMYVQMHLPVDTQSLEEVVQSSGLSFSNSFTKARVSHWTRTKTGRKPVTGMLLFAEQWGYTSIPAMPDMFYNFWDLNSFPHAFTASRLVYWATWTASWKVLLRNEH